MKWIFCYWDEPEFKNEKPNKNETNNYTSRKKTTNQEKGSRKPN